MKINSQLVEIQTKDIIGLISSIDNGMIDDIIDKKPKTEKTYENIRKQMIELLSRRYNIAIENNIPIDYELRNAYDLYLRHYT